MRYLLLTCVAALAAIALLPLVGCVDSANGLTDAIVFMSSPPAADQVKSVPTWVWLMPADGSQRTSVFDPGAPLAGIAEGALSPDGATIVYVRNDGSGIYAYNLATGQVTHLYTGINARTPSYSPDGGTIVFTDWVSGDHQSLFTMSASGASPTTLLAAESGKFFLGPIYNRAGSQIVFQSMFEGTGDICTVDADGGNYQIRESDGYNLQPSFLPDGRILYAHYEATGMSRPPIFYDLWIMDADGGNQRPLTDTPSSEYHPSSNYAGTAIAYSDFSSFEGDIFVAPFDGTDLGTPVNVTLYNGNPCWYPTFGRVRTILLESIFNPITM